MKTKKQKTMIIPILRGAVKALPMVNAIIEGVKNIKAKEKGEPLPHNWWSITIQLIGTAAIVYAFVTKLITIQDLLTLIGWTPIVPQ